MKNAAPKKTIMSSSVYNNVYSDWSPRFATDGIFQRGGIKIFHSANETSPWILVDLKDVTTVIYLRIFVRMDGAGILFLRYGFVLFLFLVYLDLIISQTDFFNFRYL